MAPRVGLFTAIQKEYEALETFLTDLTRDFGPEGTPYLRGVLEVEDGEWEVILRKGVKGQTKTAVEMVRMQQLFNTDTFVFVGTAGGIQDVEVGDVVYSNSVQGYQRGEERAAETPDVHFEELTGIGSTLATSLHEAGYNDVSDLQNASTEDLTSIDNIGPGRASQIKSEVNDIGSNAEFRPRGPGRRPSKEMRDLAEITSDQNWHRFCQIGCGMSPTAIGGSIASGEQVQKVKSKRLDKYFSGCIAIEMEGFGFMDAASELRNVDAIVVRGIMDRLWDKDEREDEKLMAATHASAFTTMFLNEYIKEDGYPISPVPKEEKKGALKQVYESKLDISGMGSEEISNAFLSLPLDEIPISEVRSKLIEQLNEQRNEGSLDGDKKD